MLPTRAISSTCCLSSWDVTEPLNRFSPWEKAQPVNDPVPGATGDNVLQWTPSTHLFFHSALPHWSWCQPVGPFIGCGLWQLTTSHNQCGLKAMSRTMCPTATVLVWQSSHCPAAVRNWKVTQPQEQCVKLCYLWSHDSLLLHINFSKVRFQHPAFLFGTSPSEGNEVMLFRNQLIYQDNGTLAISQGALLSCTNQMPGNQWT